MVDREPHRSVQLIRRIDTRVPANPLSQSSGTGSPLGKLADLRAPARASPAAASASAGSAGSGTPRASRAWNSVLTTPAPRAGTPPPAPAGPGADSLSAWTSPIGIGSERVSRSTTPSQSLVQPVAEVGATGAAPSNEAVPDNWEDDA